MTTEKADQTISEVVSRVADAMEAAVREHGPDAVDLALVAYRVSAVQQILMGLTAAVVAIVAVWAVVKIFLHTPRSPDGETGQAVGILACGMLTLFLTVSAMKNLIDAPVWIAVFGKPEVLIATRALEAAGLM